MSSNVWNKTSKQLEPFAGIPVDLLTSLTNEVGRAYGFVGTKQEWIDLPTSEKAKYVVVNLTDDDPYLIGGHDISGIGDGTVSGALVQLDADLGDKSSASAVTGNDAFAKIATLNSDLSAVQSSLPWKFTSTSLSTLNSYVTFPETPNEICVILYDSTRNNGRCASVVPELFARANIVELNTYIDKRYYAPLSYNSTNKRMTLTDIAGFGTYADSVLIYYR